jgi:hypothetical protein
MILNTGIWTQETADMGHIHSEKLQINLINLLNKEEQIIDFGCGLGFYLSKFKENNFVKLLGVEGFNLNNFLFDNVLIQDLSQSFDLNLKGNVISLEVGEHIPKNFEDVYIENITKHCDNYLIISWAVPGQGGLGHVNECENNYIINKIENKEFTYLQELSENLRSDIEDYCLYFRNTIMVFKKK